MLTFNKSLKANLWHDGNLVERAVLTPYIGNIKGGEIRLKQNN